MAVAPSTLPRPRPAGHAPRRPHLRVVPPIRHARRYVATLSVIAALGVFGVVSLGALAAESAFEAKTLEREVRDLSRRYDELTAEVASLEAPDRVARIAVEELGMIPVEDPGVLMVKGEAPARELARNLDPKGSLGSAPYHGR